MLVAPSPQPIPINRRRPKLLLAAAAVIVALVAAGVAVSLRDDEGADDSLGDVDVKEAQPLAEAAFFTEDQLGEVWSRLDAYPVEVLAEINAETRAAIPECAELTSVGLMQPTTKSALAHQDFVNELTPLLHDVWVFATPDDAARAMDMIASDLFPGCFFDFFDRTTTHGGRIVGTSESSAWTPPAIGPHGDRQVIIGQSMYYQFTYGGVPLRVTVKAINAFVQVGRAITFVDPKYNDDVGPNSNVEQTIALATAALEKVFGQA